MQVQQKLEGAIAGVWDGKFEMTTFTTKLNNVSGGKASKYLAE